MTALTAARITLMSGAAIFRVKMAEALQYRAAWLSGAATSIFWGLIEVTVYRVFFLYANQSAVFNAAMTLPQIVTYLWLTQVLFMIAPHNIDSDILEKINNGDIGIALCRPLPLYVHWYAQTVAGRLTPLVWRGIPVLVAGILMPAGWRLSAPASASGLILALLSCGLAVCLCAAYGTLVAVVRMNVTWGDGPMYMITLLGSVFSGAYLPLQLWPDFLQGFLLIQPFAGYLDIPLRLYIGTMPPSDALWGMGLQIGWTVVFIIIGQLLMSARLRKTIIQGG